MKDAQIAHEMTEAIRRRDIDMAKRILTDHPEIVEYGMRNGLHWFA